MVTAIRCTLAQLRVLPRKHEVDQLTFCGVFCGVFSVECAVWSVNDRVHKNFRARLRAAARLSLRIAALWAARLDS